MEPSHSPLMIKDTPVVAGNSWGFTMVHALLWLLVGISEASALNDMNHQVAAIRLISNSTVVGNSWRTPRPRQKIVDALTGVISHQAVLPNRFCVPWQSMCWETGDASLHWLRCTFCLCSRQKKTYDFKILGLKLKVAHVRSNKCFHLVDDA